MQLLCTHRKRHIQLIFRRDWLGSFEGSGDVEPESLQTASSMDRYR
jgi:hypothetical protein